MKKLLLVLALTVAVATPALAQINLAWRNCITVTTGATSALANINYACDASGPSPFKGVVSFISPPNITHFLCAQFTMEISTSNPVLPDYWRMGSEECRAGSFVFPINLTGIGTGATGTCQNPYSGASTAGGLQYLSGSPSANKATVVGFFTRDVPRALTSGQQYVGEAFSVDTYRDIDDGQGSGVCPGCQVPACLALVQVDVVQEIPHPTVTLTATDTRRYVTWQGGTANCSGATPSRNHTWGAIKAIYR